MGCIYTHIKTIQQVMEPKDPCLLPIMRLLFPIILQPMQFILTVLHIIPVLISYITPFIYPIPRLPMEFMPIHIVQAIRQPF